METLIWIGLVAAALLTATVGARLLSGRLAPGSRAHQERTNRQSTLEAEILTRSKGPFV